MSCAERGEAGRDPASLEVTMDSFVTSGEEALTDVKSLEALGASRVLIPAGMFGSDPAPALQRYADEVIARGRTGRSRSRETTRLCTLEEEKDGEVAVLCSNGSMVQLVEEIEAPRRGRPRRFSSHTERQLLLDASVRVMSANGYDGTSVNDILEEAGLSTRAFYRQFDSKHALFDRPDRARAGPGGALPRAGGEECRWPPRRRRGMDRCLLGPALQPRDRPDDRHLHRPVGHGLLHPRHLLARDAAHVLPPAHQGPAGRTARRGLEIVDPRGRRLLHPRPGARLPRRAPPGPPAQAGGRQDPDPAFRLARRWAFASSAPKGARLSAQGRVVAGNAQR